MSGCYGLSTDLSEATIDPETNFSVPGKRATFARAVGFFQRTPKELVITLKKSIDVFQGRKGSSSSNKI